MHPSVFDFVRALVGLGAGGIIGLAFGTLQQAALRRNERRQLTGDLKSGWNLMPAAGARVAYLLLALALIQLLCPLLFTDGGQWIVSAGVALGYGGMLWRDLRRKMAAAGK